MAHPRIQVGWHTVVHACGVQGLWARQTSEGGKEAVNLSLLAIYVSTYMLQLML